MGEVGTTLAGMQVTPARIASLLLLASVPAAAQTPSYDAGTVGCATFSESMRGMLESTFGSTHRTETLGRDGELAVHATTDSGGLAVESWYDTLSVFRQGPEGRYTPETAGILGGRYRGLLDPQGDYLASVTPFVPAGLRDIFDFGRLLLHFFPPLAPAPLLPGAEWSDGAGLTIWRLADSTGAAGPVSRYRWIRRDAWEDGVAAGDSTVIVHREEVENGGLQWRNGDGPLGWSSSTEATIEFVNGSGRSRLKQEVQVRRVATGCG